jgi:hypothetical protein
LGSHDPLPQLMARQAAEHSFISWIASSAADGG